MARCSAQWGRGGVAAGLLLAAGLGPTPARALQLQPPRFTREQMEATAAEAPPFRFVYGTRNPATAPALRSRALLLAERAFGVETTRVVADRDMSEAAMASGPVFLIGSPNENEWTRRFAPALPVAFEGGGFRWQGRLYDQPLDALQLAWPNPLAPRRFLLLAAGNTPAALARRAGLAFGDDDWRIVRAGELLRSGRFAEDGAHPWRYDAGLDHDVERERVRFDAGLRTLGDRSLLVRAPADLARAARITRDATALLARMTSFGLAAPVGGAAPTLTLYRSLEEKGAMTRDTHPEELKGTGPAPAAYAACAAGRESVDLWSVAAARLVQLGGVAQSRFLVPAATLFAARFGGETLERACSRLYFGGVLPTAEEAAARPGGWRSPLVWIPARALLVRAIWDRAPPGARSPALLALLRRDPPARLDSLCVVAGVPAAAVEQRYRLLADSLARAGRAGLAQARREPWRPAQGFQRGVCLSH